MNSVDSSLSAHGHVCASAHTETDLSGNGKNREHSLAHDFLHVDQHFQKQRLININGSFSVWDFDEFLFPSLNIPMF